MGEIWERFGRDSGVNLVNQYKHQGFLIHGENMDRKYIALALAGLVGVAALINAGVIGVSADDGSTTDTGTDGDVDASDANEPGNTYANDTGFHGPGSNGERFRHQGMEMNQRGNREGPPGMGMNQYQDDELDQFQGNEWCTKDYLTKNYLNITRLEGILAYNNGTFMVDTTVLYFGNELFLKGLAKSDYDGDGIYEYVWQELEGLIGTELVVNGILDGDTLYVSHINGIYLTMPKQTDITELEGILERTNGSFFVNGTQLLITKRGISMSDIDGDDMLEPLAEELNGLLGENVSVDGTTIEGGLIVIHINGIWAR